MQKIIDNTNHIKTEITPTEDNHKKTNKHYLKEKIKYETIHNNKGVLIRSVLKHNNLEIISKYDQNGNLQSEAIQSNKELLIRKYNKNGQIISISRDGEDISLLKNSLLKLINKTTEIEKKEKELLNKFKDINNNLKKILEYQEFNINDETKQIESVILESYLLGQKRHLILENKKVVHFEINNKDMYLDDNFSVYFDYNNVMLSYEVGDEEFHDSFQEDNIHLTIFNKQTQTKNSFIFNNNSYQLYKDDTLNYTTTFSMYDIRNNIISHETTKNKKDQINIDITSDKRDKSISIHFKHKNLAIYQVYDANQKLRKGSVIDAENNIECYERYTDQGILKVKSISDKKNNLNVLEYYEDNTNNLEIINIFDEKSNKRTIETYYNNHKILNVAINEVDVENINDYMKTRANYIFDLSSHIDDIKHNSVLSILINEFFKNSKDSLFYNFENLAKNKVEEKKKKRLTM